MQKWRLGKLALATAPWLEKQDKLGEAGQPENVCREVGWRLLAKAVDPGTCGKAALLYGRNRIHL